MRRSPGAAMPIKTVLVPLDGSEKSLRVLETALVVAQRFGAHIDVVHVLQRAADAAPFMFDRLSKALKENVVRETENDAREHAGEVRAIFERFCAAHDVVISERPRTGMDAVSAAWHQEFGRVSEVLVRRGRLADVVAIAKPGTSDSSIRRSPPGENLEAILLGTGRPVLIVPPNWEARRVEHVVVGWNESVEAARALAMTMPWLPQMRAVTVAVSKKRHANVQALLDYLAWHGVDAQIELLDGKGESVGEALLNVCETVQAEFLVVGGFSRARARQLLFGGVTRHLLTHARLLTAMVH